MDLVLSHPPLRYFQRLLSVLWLSLVLSSGVSSAADSENDGPRHQLKRVSDTLYQFTDGHQAGVVLLTEAGAVVVDPMNDETALWLQGELKSRFSQEARYVVYSSTLQDRIGGANVFAQNGSTIIAHENTVAFFQDNETLPPPDIVFSQKLSLQLKSTSVDLHFFGKSLTDNTIAVHFPSEQAMYAGNIVAAEAFPVVSEDVLAAAHIPEWFNTINRMNRIDFIYLLTAQEKIGIQHDGIRHSHFLRELHHRVSRALALEEAEDSQLRSLTMDNYHRWRHQDQLPNLISGVKQLILQD